MWPCKFEAQILVKNLEKAIPGLTVVYSKSGEEIPLPIQNQFIIKMANDREERVKRMRKLRMCKPASTYRPRAKPGKASNKKRKMSDPLTYEFEGFDSRRSEEEDGSTSKLSNSEYPSGAEDEQFEQYYSF